MGNFLSWCDDDPNDRGLTRAACDPYSFEYVYYDGEVRVVKKNNRKKR